MSENNILPVILRTNTNHQIKCSAAVVRELNRGVGSLFDRGCLSHDEVRSLVATLPPSFFADNGFDSPSQYSNLLWDALDTSDLAVSSGNETRTSNLTVFNAPVQTQVLQTGSGSSTRVIQTSQQNQLYSKTLIRKLETISAAVKRDIQDENDRREALKLVDQVKAEASQEAPDASKIKKALAGFAKWTGERLTKAVDAALKCGVEYGIKGPGS